MFHSLSNFLKLYCIFPRFCLNFRAFRPCTSSQVLLSAQLLVCGLIYLFARFFSFPVSSRLLKTLTSKRQSVSSLLLYTNFFNCKIDKFGRGNERETVDARTPNQFAGIRRVPKYRKTVSFITSLVSRMSRKGSRCT